jgi:tetratricopeptide (TPR) repeat protein
MVLLLPAFTLLAAFGFAADVLYARQGAPAAVETPIGRILGGAKEVFGSALFIKADVYFHGGTEAPGEETAEEMAREGVLDAGHAAPRAPLDWIAAINGRVKSHEHRHMTEEEQKEMLPFFKVALELDPHNIDAILTAAYWLDKRMKKTGEAISVLEKGVRDNPGSWEIEYRLGALLLETEKDYAAVSERLASAAAKAEGAELQRFQRVDLAYFLGEALRLGGRPGEAAAAYRKALSFYRPGEESLLKADIESKLSSSAVAGS